MTTQSSPTVPVYDLDLYDAAAIADPYPHYRALRDLGPVVWLPRHGVYALPRYAQVRATLADDDTFRTSFGVSLNPEYGALLEGSTFASDGSRHRFLRGVVAQELAPRKLRGITERVAATADTVADELLAGGEFDAVTDLARRMVLAIVPDFIGIPEDGREHLVDWAAANFNCHGPLNARARASMTESGCMAAYAQRLVDERAAQPSGVAHRVLEALDRDEIDAGQAVSLMIDYLAPSLDTTVTGISTAIWLFGRYPEQWQRVREDPALIPHAFNEVLRFETPVRAFGRRVSRDTEIAGTVVPQGAQVLILFASANRDERKWDRADVFDVGRKPTDHVGFGYGVHGCVGQGLARLETHTLLAALARRVERFEVGGERWAINNLMRALDTAPTRVHAA
ncbi:putative cytochrome P450 [Nocardia nova SH22a]|uniref:Putative cytochrome P450 n=1 Tax=Nocardia nova SH22a TaxID=1415166 RepID=W5TPB8_9NOCA|nr:cytochrome P450 [Nocardia nova]AHH20979.1 putative cytochrome P450 [Nocardia nova SH22a]